MFEELGLNVARQEDNGANPRPDNRSGWLDGETPRTPVDELIDSQDGSELLEPERHNSATERRHPCRHVPTERPTRTRS